MIKFLTVPVLIALLIVSNLAAFARGMSASSFAPGHHFAHFDHFRHRHHFTHFHHFWHRHYFASFATAIGLGWKNC